MSRVFVIPDIHLKPWMFTKADDYISIGHFDAVVMLGDLVDDWGEEYNISLYNETFDAAIEFCRKYRGNLDVRYCIGNHDISYIWQRLESGYSSMAYKTVNLRTLDLKEELPMENRAFIHRFDNVLFSHAGLSEYFVLRNFASMPRMSIDDMIAAINRMGPDELWRDESPLWVRPQGNVTRMYPRDMFQVVGHTPVKKAQLDGTVLTLDTFSTMPNGTPIGDEKFVWIDTEKLEYHVILEKTLKEEVFVFKKDENKADE